MDNKELKAFKKEQKLIKEELGKIYDEMPDKWYSAKDTNSYGAFLKLNEGGIIVIDKARVSKSICVSYNEHVSGSIERAREAISGDNLREAVIKDTLNNLKHTLKAVLDSPGVFYYDSHIPGQKNVLFVHRAYEAREVREDKGVKYTEFSKDEKERYVKAINYCLCNAMARLESYFAKYGTSKIRAWTYSCWD